MIRIQESYADYYSATEQEERKNCWLRKVLEIQKRLGYISQNSQNYNEYVELLSNMTLEDLRGIHNRAIRYCKNRGIEIIENCNNNLRTFYSRLKEVRKHTLKPSPSFSTITKIRSILQSQN